MASPAPKPLIIRVGRHVSSTWIVVACALVILSMVVDGAPSRLASGAAVVLAALNLANAYRLSRAERRS
jgi:hypothetical protein